MANFRHNARQPRGQRAGAAHGDRQGIDDMNGFVVRPRRWVVERTFSWLGRNYRLANDFENLASTRQTFVTLPSGGPAGRRLLSPALVPPKNAVSNMAPRQRWVLLPRRTHR
jgi:hypothetical protein